MHVLKLKVLEFLNTRFKAIVLRGATAGDYCGIDRVWHDRFVNKCVFVSCPVGGWHIPRENICRERFSSDRFLPGEKCHP